MNLQLCFRKPNPSHGAKMIAALPSAEDFFDPGTDRTQGPVVRFDACGLKPAMALAHQLWGSALGFDRRLNGKRIIGAIAIDLARIIGDDRGSDSDIGLVRRRRFDRADDPGVLGR
jgi:hypothetical protein